MNHCKQCSVLPTDQPQTVTSNSLLHCRPCIAALAAAAAAAAALLAAGPRLPLLRDEAPSKVSNKHHANACSSVQRTLAQHATVLACSLRDGVSGWAVKGESWW